jgi:hypothetical protein
MATSQMICGYQRPLTANSGLLVPNSAGPVSVPVQVHAIIFHHFKLFTHLLLIQQIVQINLYLIHVGQCQRGLVLCHSFNIPVISLNQLLKQLTTYILQNILQMLK